MVLYSCFISIIILSNYSGTLVTLDQRDVDSEVFPGIFRLRGYYHQAQRTLLCHWVWAEHWKWDLMKHEQILVVSTIIKHLKELIKVR